MTTRHRYIVLMSTCSHNSRHSPFSATPLRRIAIIALLMSSSDAMDESTSTTSKSTGTQQNLASHKALRLIGFLYRRRLFFHRETYVEALRGCLRPHRNNCCTWWASSGPIPSPGIRVTVCLPPYCAGGGCKKRFLHTQLSLHATQQYTHTK